MAQIASADCIAEFKRARSDDEVTEWNIDSLRRFLTADPRDDFSCSRCDGIDGKRSRKFIEKSLPTLTQFQVVGSKDSVTNLRDRDRTENHGDLAHDFLNRLNRLIRPQASTFGCDEEARIKY
jgi:hypothetical protein